MTEADADDSAPDALAESLADDDRERNTAAVVAVAEAVADAVAVAVDVAVVVVTKGYGGRSVDDGDHDRDGNDSAGGDDDVDAVGERNGGGAGNGDSGSEGGGWFESNTQAVAASEGARGHAAAAEWSLSFPSSLENLGEQWREMPSRYRVCLGTCFAFVLCNMDKVNISVAIIPMAKDMGWSVSTAGFLQSAFFYGFALSQLPGGYLATRFGGAKMLPIGVFVWSAATAVVPFVAGDTKMLFLSRVLVGLGEGISPAAATDVIARSVPLKERSRAVAFVFNGFNIGSVLGLSLSPFIIEGFGWKTVFLIFGALGLLWVQWVGLGIYTRGGAMPEILPDATGPTAPVQGLTGKRKMLPEPEIQQTSEPRPIAASHDALSANQKPGLKLEDQRVAAGDRPIRARVGVGRGGDAAGATAATTETTTAAVASDRPADDSSAPPSQSTAATAAGTNTVTGDTTQAPIQVQAALAANSAGKIESVSASFKYTRELTMGNQSTANEQRYTTDEQSVADEGGYSVVKGSAANAVEEKDPPVPWAEILRSTPVRALAYVHFCNNWGFYVLLAWLPSYFTTELEVNLTNASLFTLLPPLANIVVASFVGPLADNAIARGVEVSTVRKGAQAIAFLGPATFMAAACFADNPVATVGLLTVGLSLASFSYAGLYCNHQDMSPRYASILLGMTNTMGAFPGVIGVPLTGYLLEKTDNWEVSMFLPAVFFYITGAAVFAKWGTAEKQSWG